MFSNVNKGEKSEGLKFNLVKPTMAKKSKFYFKITVFNLITNEEKTYRVNDTEEFKLPNKIVGWDCRLLPVEEDGFKSLICIKNKEILITSAGCGPRDDRMNIIQLASIRNEKEIPPQYTIKLLCPAEQF